MSILQNSIIPTSSATGFNIDNSLRFNDDDSTYLSRTPSSASNRKTWTWSGWVKRVNPTGNQFLFNAGSAYNNTTTMYIGADGKLSFMYRTSSVLKRKESTRLLRDPSAWYHIVFSIDSTQSTASNRARIYVNGEEVTAFDDNADVDLNQDHHINDTTTHKMSSDSNNGYADGQLAEVHFIDGQSFFSDTSGTASTTFNIDSFGETGDYGEWKAKKVSGLTYGTNGFYLNFKGGDSIIAATGGTITTDGDHKVHTFTSDGTFNITSVSGSAYIEYLVVGGGGAGGTSPEPGDGGDAGTYNSATIVGSVQSYSVTVGASGLGDGGAGGSSSFGSVTSAGGAGGPSGGTGYSSYGVGGGGASGPTVGAGQLNGIDGLFSGISGIDMHYAGGGGGGAFGSGYGGGVGGLGGGGNGANGTGIGSSPGARAVNGTGGGGGGTHGIPLSLGPGSNEGGSGVVVIRYRFQ